MGFEKIDRMLDEFEKKLRQQQFELRLKYSFHWVEINGKWLDRIGMVTVSSISSKEIGYLNGITGTYQNQI